jgi:hypothetical protein
MILQIVLYESGTGALTVKEENTHMLHVFNDKRSEGNFYLKERKAEHVDVMMTL